MGGADYAQNLKIVAEVHLDVLFPNRRFDVEVFADINRMAMVMIARFENAHGPQFVRQVCGIDCPWKEFRWSDNSITQMMLLE